MANKGRQIYVPSYIKLHPKIKRIVEDTAVEYLIDTSKAGYPAILLDESSPFQTPESIEMQWEYLLGEILDEPGDYSFQDAKAKVFLNRAPVQFYIKSTLNTIKERAEQKLRAEGRNLEEEDYILGLKIQSASPVAARRGRPVTRTMEERFHSKGKGQHGTTRGRPKGTGYLQRGVTRAADAPQIGRKPFTEEEKRLASEAYKASRAKLPDWSREFVEPEIKISMSGFGKPLEEDQDN